MISEAILIPKIYARLQEIASNFSKFSGGGPRPPAGVRVFGALFGDSPPYRAPFPKFLDPPLDRLTSDKVSAKIKVACYVFMTHGV